MQASKETRDNRQTAISFLELASSGQLDEAYSKVSKTFRHHNAYFPADTESLKNGMGEAYNKFPNTKLDVQRSLAEGDLVAVHSRVQHAPETAAISVVHIFRFEGNEIAELWDVGMEVPKDSPNKNGVF
jgi:predicted SnoaL-like aldol condensation-catalyzing enzyme